MELATTYLFTVDFASWISKIRVPNLYYWIKFNFWFEAVPILVMDTYDITLAELRELTLKG
jgi:hypothetical protein